MNNDIIYQQIEYIDESACNNELNKMLVKFQDNSQLHKVGDNVIITFNNYKKGNKKIIGVVTKVVKLVEYNITIDKIRTCVITHHITINGR